MSNDGWNRVSKEKLCPICQKADNCTVSADGGAVWCGRVSEGSKRENGGGQFLHILREDWWDRDWTPPISLKQKTSEPTVRDFSKVVDAGFSHPDAAHRRSELANELGVEPKSLEQLGVGWDKPKRKQSHWTIPERDATGNVIGVSTRLENGNKRFVTGGQRGLTYASDWREGKGPILLVEGASDTAALMSMGLSVVGRPSNVGGFELLTELLREIPDDREIIVVGENDRKAHDSLSESVRGRHKDECKYCSNCWPGKYGAIKTAEKLSQLLCREVGWCLTPDDKKDSREWLRIMRDPGAT